MAKVVEYNYVTGQPMVVLSQLKISVANFLVNNSDVKVGITGRDPQERFKEHLKKKDWDRMIVKYKTTSERNANKLEDLLIENYPELINEWMGTSYLSEDGDNYLYVLVKK
jgi:hypothetical protein